MAIVSPVRAWRTMSSRMLAGNVSARVDSFLFTLTTIHAIDTPRDQPPLIPFLTIHQSVAGELVADHRHSIGTFRSPKKIASNPCTHPPAHLSIPSLSPFSFFIRFADLQRDAALIELSVRVCLGLLDTREIIDAGRDRFECGSKIAFSSLGLAVGWHAGWHVISTFHNESDSPAVSRTRASGPTAC